MQKLQTVPEIAEYLGFKPRTIYKWVQEKTIPHYRLSSKIIRFDLATVDAWIDTHYNGYGKSDLSKCPECDEVVLDENGELDARVQAGMKCGRCAYG